MVTGLSPLKRSVNHKGPITNRFLSLFSRLMLPFHFRQNRIDPQYCRKQQSRYLEHRIERQFIVVLFSEIAEHARAHLTLSVDAV